MEKRRKGLGGGGNDGKINSYYENKTSYGQGNNKWGNQSSNNNNNSNPYKQGSYYNNNSNQNTNYGN